MKKKTLEMTLQQIPYHPEPKARLEQYKTPADIASDVLYFAHSLGDIEQKKVVDLGCGTGIFAIGAKLLGAGEVIGMDIDEKSLEIARKIAEKIGVEVDFYALEIKDFNGDCDTVLQNPPFGAQKKHADRPFLLKALTISKVVYSLHLAKTREYIEKEAKIHKASITHEKNYEFEIRHTFDFHTKEKKYFDVMMFRIESNEGMR